MTDFGGYEGIRDLDPSQMLPGLPGDFDPEGDPDLLTDADADQLEEAAEATDAERDAKDD
ncbi:hypothetical protein [Plantibacter sp. YIM 135347]|uniref:hypothetical protein n=1 Tax=Plantibacter sp. YIM 135347 TaxID=3423919 RepID=UPI003D335CD4